MQYGASLALAAWPGAFARAARSHDFYFTRLTYESGDWDAYPGAAGAVLRALSSVASLRADPLERVVALGDPRMLESPFCYLCGHKLVQFTAAERRNLERFVRAGGFLLVDDCSRNPRGLFARSFEAEMRQLFGARALLPLPNAHALYTSFFHLDGGGALRAIAFGGRVRVLYANQNFAQAWSEGQGEPLRLAVNIIHYALGV
ncbi:MAG: DUF4159 domain-containing protein [Gammaproteobacteria bacterium]